ncbi:MAG: hypothetical protein ACRD3G_31765, partial [Vicinamibacterales bacterium]
YFLTVFLQQFYVYLTNVLTGCDSSHTKPQKRLESELTFIRGGSSAVFRAGHQGDAPARRNPAAR